jgi:predicted PurR-regulated permease PerM
VDFRDHLRTTSGALKGWLIATAYDALAVGVLWLVGLLIIGVPWALLWAILGALLQFVPQFGIMLALVPPAFVGLVSGGFNRLLYVLLLYAVVVVADALIFQPMFMKRRARVPIWASVPTPLILGFFFSFWGVLLAPPLLAIIFGYREHVRKQRGRMLPGAGISEEKDLHQPQAGSSRSGVV